MSAISDFAAKQNAFNDKLNVHVAGITDDVNNLKDLIKQLQESPGSVTPEDQALLDDLDAKSQVIADKMEALDAMTPPNPPVV